MKNGGSMTLPPTRGVPRLSLIIPAGRASPISGVALAVEAMARRTPDLEILWVSPHETAPTPAGPSVRKVRVPVPAPPGALRNRGAAEARGDVLLFLDDDCIPPPDWAERMAAALEADRRLGAVGCRYASDDGDWVSRAADHALFPVCVATKPAERPVGSAAMAVRAEAFREAGGFDERLRASEDWDFGLRLLRAGWRVRYNPTIVVTHRHGRRTLSGILRSAFQSGQRSGLIVQRRYRAQMTAWARLAVLLGHPAVYPLHALADTALQVGLHVLREARRDPRVLTYGPVCVAARLAYHAGVWRALLRREDDA